MSAPTVPPPTRFLESALHDVFRRVNAYDLERPETHVSHLHVGEAGFSPPEGVGEAIAGCFARGDAGYCDGVGLTLLRDVLADKVVSETGRCCSAERVVVSPGSTHALYALFTLLAEPGAPVLLPAPFWPVYLQQVAALGLSPRFYGVHADGSVERDAVSDALRDGCRLLLLNSPANPTGGVLQPAEIAWLTEAAAAHGAAVISDEAYEDFAFGAPHFGVASVAGSGTGVPPIFTTHTFSKTFALTGLRVGYVVCSDPSWAAALGQVQEATLVCPSTPAQYGALHAMTRRDSAVARARAHLQAARRAVFPRLAGMGLIDTEPAGGWYVMCDIPPAFASSEAFAHHLLTQHAVGVAPGTSFGPPVTDRRGSAATDRQVRIALCGDLDALVRGVDRLADALSPGG